MNEIAGQEGTLESSNSGDLTTWQRGYVVAIAAAGALVLLGTCFLQVPQVDWSWAHTGPGFVLALLLFAGELRRMLVVRKDGDSERLSVSSTFAVALVLTGPL